MREINSRQRTKLKIYKQKTNLSSLLQFVSGLGVLAFGIYFREIFEIVGGIFLLVLSAGQLAMKNKIQSPYSIIKREKGMLKYLAIEILAFSLINPIGILPAIYDLFKRDRVLSGELDED
jgi:arginine exporter protein ArgO